MEKRVRQVRVWAPRASEVFADATTAQVAMQSEARGWWSGMLPDDTRDYAFCLDGGLPIPDPRSPWQPAGVHGKSRFLDHDTWHWTDAGWQPPPLRSAVIYEMHIGTFTNSGTFEAAISRIPHLIDLGITHVEIMPVAEFSGEWGWGYDGVSLYAPHHSYGGPEQLKRLIDALHANGIAAILDVVYNHLGPSGNYLSHFGPYFTPHVKTPWGDAMNFSEAGSDNVRAFLIENALMWLRDYHFDGLRLDAVHTISDYSAIHFLEEITRRVKQLQESLGRHLSVIAESDLNDPRLIRDVTHSGYALDAQWSDDFHHALHTVLTGESVGYYADFGRMADLAKAICSGYVYDGCYSTFRDRHHGRPLDESLRPKLVCCLQNHDQIGNRAQGERIHMLTSLERVRAAAALVLLGPGIPLIFQGEEWAASSPFLYFTNHAEPELAHAVSEGRKREFAAFGWRAEDVPDPQSPDTFQRSKLKWSELAEHLHSEMFEWYRMLIRLRRTHPELQSSQARVSFDENTGSLVMHRPGVCVDCNLKSGDVEVREDKALAAVPDA